MSLPPTGANEGAGERRGGHGINLALNTFGNALAPAASIITLPILAHTLGVQGRGAVAAATAPLLFANAIATVGLPDAMVYFIAQRRFDAARLLRRLSILTLITGVLACATLIALAPLLSGGHPHLARYIEAVALAVIPTLIVSLTRGLAIGLQAWPTVRLEQLIASLFSLAAISTLSASSHLTVPIAIAVVAATPTIGGLAYIRLAKLLRRGRGATEIPNSRAILGYSARSWIGSTAGVAVARLDQTLMTLLSSPYQLGLYAVAVGVSELPLVINGAVSITAFTTDAAERNDRRLAMSARISFSLCFLVAACICGSAPFIFPLVFGPGFSAAIPTTVVLSAAVVLGMPGSVAGSALAARGTPILRSAGLMAAAFVNVILLIALVPRLGEMGAALATLGANAIGALWALSSLKRIHKVQVLQFYGFKREDASAIISLARALGRNRKGAERP